MSQIKKAGLLFLASLVAAIIYGMVAQPTQAGSDDLETWGPDIHGVVCYSKSGIGGSNPISCVRVY